MNKISAAIVLSIGTLLTLSGCAPRYPMGLDEKSWAALPPQERARLREEEYKMQTALEKERERHRHEERLKELAIEKEKEARLNRLYAKAGYKDVVRVNLQGGCFNLYKKCVPFRPVSVLLVRGETKRIELKSEWGDARLWIRYDFSGVAVDDDENLDDWDAAVFLPDYWEMGHRYVLNLKDPWRKDRYVLENVNVFIRYFDDGSRRCR